MGGSRQTWQRARSPEQKEERVQAILEAAGELFDEQGLDGTGLNAIARAAGLSKPNLYVYFESREAILLRLLLDECTAWSEALARRLRKLAGCDDVAAVADAYARSMLGRRRFCVMLAAVSAVLENNVGPKTVAEFKRSLMVGFEPVVGAFVAALPRFDAEKAFQVLGVLTMASVGMWSHCHPAPAAAEVLAMPEFRAMKMDFEPSVREHAEAYLLGVLQQLDD